MDCARRNSCCIGVLVVREKKSFPCSSFDWQYSRNESTIVWNALCDDIKYLA